MNARRFWNGLQSVCEILLILALFLAAVSILTQPMPSGPIGDAGPIVKLIGSAPAAYFYAFVWTAEGVLLAWSKIFRKKAWRKNILLAVYLTLIFTIFLEFAVTGFGLEIIDNLILTLMAGFCYLRWKLRTEYLNLTQLNKSIKGL